jgi:hypothetical protein
VTHPLAPDGALGRVADGQLRDELPGLPDERRAATVEFVCRRAGDTPGPLRIGVTVASVLTDVAGRVVDPATVRGLRIPLVGELPRLVRSLAVAFVWETWPDTRPDGAPAEAVA